MINSKTQLPGVTIPGGTTHKYVNEHGKVTYYKVQQQRNIMTFYRKVWFWDVYRNIWTRSYCHPDIKVMTTLR